VKKTVLSLQKKKENKEKIVALTAYDYYTAKLLDKEEFDFILVGDSLSMVFAGHETTLPITMEEMLYHTKVVSRAVKNTMVVADMPFMSYHVSKEQAISNAGRFLKESGANAVKLEGGKEKLEIIKAIIDCGIPVLGHIGLTPQSINKLGAYKVCGKKEKEAIKLLEDAKALEAAGCFAIVLECVPSVLAKELTESIKIPTIGIGSGKDCDGQILVVNDILGMGSNVSPRFVKKYADLNSIFNQAFKEYKADVVSELFPDKEHSF